MMMMVFIFLTEPLSNKDTEDSEEDEDIGPKPFNPTAAGLSQKE